MRRVGGQLGRLALWAPMGRRPALLTLAFVLVVLLAALPATRAQATPPAPTGPPPAGPIPFGTEAAVSSLAAGKAPREGLEKLWSKPWRRAWGLIGSAIFWIALTVLGLLAGGKVSVTKRNIMEDDPAKPGAQRVAVSEGDVIPAGVSAAPGQEQIVRGRALRRLWVGSDNRVSTSKVQVLLWTYTLLFALVAIILAAAFGADEGYKALLEEGLKDEYLLFLGGSFAAGVGAKVITTTKAQNGTVAKTQATTASSTGTQGLAQIVNDDGGGTDLGDFQYLMFNVVAVLFFYTRFLPHSVDGLPEIPDLLVGLTGVAAAAYVSKKAAEKAAPTLRSVVPGQAAPGATVEIWGDNLVVPAREGMAAETGLPRVSFGAYMSSDVKIDDHAAADHLTAKVPLMPAGGEPQEAPVQVTTALGISPDPLPFKVSSGVTITGVSPSRVRLGATREITVLGTGFGGDFVPARNALEIDGVRLAADAAAWKEEGVVRATVPTAAGDLAQLGLRENQQAPVVVRNHLGLASTPWTVRLEKDS